MPPSTRHSIAGFSLVEVVLALGIAAFAVLAVVALMPVGLHLAQNSTEQNQASNLLSAIASDLENCPPANPATPCFAIAPTPWHTGASGVVPVPDATVGTDYLFYASDGQTVTAARGADSRYRVTLRYTRIPGQSGAVPDDAPSATSPAPVEALLTVSWPPAADIQSATVPPQGRVEAVLAFPKP